MKRFAIGVLWFIVGLGALVLSLWAHISTQAGRDVARNVLNDYVNGEMAGSLAIGSFEELQWWGGEAVDVDLLDPEGRVVLHAERVTVRLDLGALSEGRLHFTHGNVRGGEVVLYPDEEGIPSFIAAFEAATPSNEPPSPDGIVAIVDDLHVRDFVVRGDVLGLEGIRVEDVRAHGRLVIDSREEFPVDIRIFDGGGRVVAPFPYATELDRIVGRVRDDPEHGTRFHVRAHTDEGDAVRVNVEYRQYDPEGEEELDLLVNADPVHLERLAESGLGFAEILTGPIRGYVRLRGPTDELRITADLETEGGRLTLDGEIPTEREGSVTLRTDSLWLDQVVVGAPPIELRGEFTVSTGETTDVTVELDPFTYEGFDVPATRVRGRFTEDGFVVTEATADVVGGGRLTVRGDVGFDGSIDLTVSGRVARLDREPNLRRLVPGLRGSASLNGNVRLEDGELFVDGRWVFYDVGYGPARAQRLVAVGGVRGPTDALRVRLGLEANGAFVADIPFGDGTGRLDGGPTLYTGRVSMAHPERAISFDATGRMSGGGVRMDVGPMEIRSRSERWAGNVQGLYLGTSATEVSAFALSSGAQRITGSGRWDQRRGRDDELHLEATSVDIGSLAAFIGEGLNEIDGLFTGSADIGGDLEAQPTLDVDVTFERGRLLDVTGLDGSLLARYAHGQLEVDAGILVEGGGELDLEVRGSFDTDTRLRDAYELGAYGAILKLRNLDLGLLAALGLERLPPLEGRAGGVVNASGALDLFDFHGQIEVPALRVGDFPAIGIATNFAFEDGAVVARVLTHDAGGELIEAEGSVLLDLISALEEPELLLPMLDASPWRIAVRMPPRELGTLPAPIAEQIPGADVLRGSLAMTLRGGAYVPRADVLANVEYAGELRDALCGIDAAPRATLRGRLRNDQAEAEVVGFVGAARVLQVEANATAPLAEWLRHPETFATPSTDVNAYVINAPLEGVPGACVYASGPLSANVELRNLFAENSTAFLELFSDSISARRLETTGRGPRRQVIVREETPSSRFRMVAELANGALTTDGELAWWNGGSTTFSGEIPMRWGGAIPIPEIEEDAELYAWSDFTQMPLAAAITWLPAVANVEGGLSGVLRVEGPYLQPSFSGEIELADGRVEIPSVGQHLEDVAGTFLLEDDRITFQGLRVRDGDGLAHVAGDLSLEGFSPELANLRLEAEQFPIRQEGSVLATIDGNAGVVARFQPRLLEGDVEVSSLHVRLAQDLGRTPQDLADHPEVRVVGRRAGEPPSDPFTIVFNVDTVEPIAVKHDDFAANASARLTVLYADPRFEISGAVTLGTGHFDVFGKRFEVERGAMVFDAAHPFDPEVNLSAVHNLRSSETVTVSASGRLSDPVIRFSSSRTDDRAEIIAMLVSGDIRRETDTEIERAPTDFLAGIAAGVLTLSLREQFGTFIPTIAIESNELGGARIRTGWRLEDFLPERIREVVQGAYVEGFFNTTGEDGGNQRTLGQVHDYGFRLEIAWPRNVVNAATYSPPTNFSLDVTYEP